MSDSRLEERLRSALHGEADDLPLTITSAELERRLAARRRDRNGQRLTLMAAGIAAVAVGAIVALTNGWLSLPPSGGPSPAPIVSTAPDASGAPSPSAPASPAVQPSPSAPAVACDNPLDPTTSVVPPGMAMGTTQGDSIAYDGAIGSFVLGDGSPIDEGQWFIPEPGTFATVPLSPTSGDLVVLPADGCIQIVASAALESALGTDGFRPITLETVPADTGNAITVRRPDPGRWIVRIDAYFASTSGVIRSLYFFRVDVADPAASPTPPPTTLPNLAAPSGTVKLEADDATAGAGIGPDPAQAVAVGTVGKNAIYDVTAVCLGDGAEITWSLGRFGARGTLTARPVPCDGTAYTTQVTVGIPTAEPTVYVSGEPTTHWRILVSSPVDDYTGFEIPALSASAEGQPADSGTLTYIQCGNHNGSGDSCPGPWYRQLGAGQVTVPAGTGLVVGLGGGWSITSVDLRAMPTELIRSYAFPSGEREITAGTDLTGATVTIPLDLPPGAWTVRVSLNAAKGSDTIGGWYDVPIIVP